MQITQSYRNVNGIRLHVAQAGPANGRPVILLHGFPDFWRTWLKQMEFLAARRFHVVALDQRGYNLSDKPRKLAAYNIDQLAADVTGLMDVLRFQKAIVVGHDWGGSVAWRTAQRDPERVEKLVILNVPHSTILRRAIRSNWKQRRRSWYIFFFQIPWLPEKILSARNFQILTSRSGWPGENEPDLYREAWSQPGAMHGMIQWYRALLRTKSQRMPSPRIQVPTLMIWGEQDRYLGKELAQPSIELCDSGTLKLLPHAGHWVHHDAPDDVHALLSEFLLP